MRVSEETGLKLIERAERGESVPIQYPSYDEWLEWVTGPNADEVAEFGAPDDLKFGFREAWIAGFKAAMETAQQAYNLRGRDDSE